MLVLVHALVFVLYFMLMLMLLLMLMLILTVLTRISVPALIKFSPLKMQRLFEGGTYLKVGNDKEIFSFKSTLYFYLFKKINSN